MQLLIMQYDIQVYDVKLTASFIACPTHKHTHTHSHTVNDFLNWHMVTQRSPDGGNKSFKASVPPPDPVEQIENVKAF